MPASHQAEPRPNVALVSSSDASGELASAYATLRGGLLTWFTRRVEDPDTAEDLVQLVFAKALAASRRDGIAGKLVPWLHAIARNVLVDHYRSRRPMHPLPEDLAQDAGEDRASEQALAGCLRAFTEELPAIYRDVLLETEFERKTLGEVADQLGVSLSAVKSRASRGRTKLKGLLLSCCDVEQLPSGAVADHSPRPGGCCANTQCCD